MLPSPSPVLRKEDTGLPTTNYATDYVRINGINDK